MQTYRVNGTIGPDHRVLLTVPRECPVGEAEFVVIPPAQPQDSNRQRLNAFLDDLDRRTAGGRSKEDIDRQIRDLRDSWD